MSRLRFSLIFLFLATACSRNSDGPAIHAFHRHPPHGGAPVALGDDFNLEFVLDPSAGRLDAYIFDDDMEEFVRVAMPSFDALVTAGGEKRTLVFKAVPNPATGETVGNTSLFTAQADWLKSAGQFDVVLPKIEVHGQKFENLAFRFPKGLDSQ